MSSKTQPDKAVVLRPLRIAVTGGIGSGKSYVCRLIEQNGFPVFYCDDEAKRIMRTDTQVRQALTELIGPECYDACGQPVKAVLAHYICADTAHAARVNAIVHPAVGRAFESWAKTHQPGPVFMECALLFEAGFDRYADVTIHIATSQETRLRRVMARDGIAQEKALEWMSLQMSEEEKAHRADRVLHNDEKDDIRKQTTRLLADILHMCACPASGTE